ncbi:MAG: NfeD family protein [Clostridia bacterium]|nr:NfeD family protein [Clostridia bacterium]
MWFQIFGQPLQLAASVLIDKVNYIHPAFWLAVLIFSIVVESVTSDLVSIWFAPAAFVSMILSFFFNLTVQIIAFAVISMTLIILSKTLLRRTLEKNVGKPQSGVEQLIGTEVLVVEDIDNDSEAGAVKVNGQLWSARTESAEDKPVRGDRVEIVKINGSKLICRPAQNN